MGSPEMIRNGIRPLRLELAAIAARAGEVARANEEARGGSSSGHGYVERSARNEAASIIDAIAQSLGKMYEQDPQTPLIQTLATICNAYGDSLDSDGTRVNVYQTPLYHIAKSLARVNLRWSLDDTSRRSAGTTTLDMATGFIDTPPTIASMELQLTNKEQEIIDRVRTLFPNWRIMRGRTPDTHRLIHTPPDTSDIVGLALHILEREMRQAEVGPTDASEITE